MVQTASNGTRIRLGRLVAAWLVMVSVVGNVVHADNASVSLRVEPPQVRLVGNLDRLQLQGTGTDGGGRQYDLTHAASYSLSSGDIASVSKTGAVVPLASGTGKIRVQYGAGAVEIPVRVTEFLPQAKVSFVRDVVPILSRSGCNQGTCHGAQYGKGGLKLIGNGTWCYH